MPPYFFHNANAPVDDAAAPLPLPSTPAASTVAIEKETKWMPFSLEDNAKIEAAWQAVYVAKSIDGNVIDDTSGRTGVVSVIVGKARLYAVQFKVNNKHAQSLPGPVVAKLVPIYWRPMHDTAHVFRATWFYTSPLTTRRFVTRGRNNEITSTRRYSAKPIVDLRLVENLERGFLEVQPWHAGYHSELRSVKKTGRPAEDKIKFTLSSEFSAVFWPLPVDESDFASRSARSRRADLFTRDIPPKEGVTLADSTSNNRSGFAVLVTERIIVRTFAGRRQGVSKGTSLVLGAVSKHGGPDVRLPGKGIGGVVKRGFDYDDWIAGGGKINQGQWADKEIEHLILVVHGIGQKLSERVETFDFTYAINNFRVLISEQHLSLGISKAPPAVLPVNWRRKINFEEDEITSESGNANGDSSARPSSHRAFSLNDITPPTIPAVRHIISDVLLDIPYYMSKHRPRVLQAVVKEANRIYRLWIRNNPEWKGKISIIGHSLGSVIAADILSRQPTIAPSIYSQTDDVNAVLEFTIRNFFLAGSPVGFFMLLNKANLIPRLLLQGRVKTITSQMPQLGTESGYDQAIVDSEVGFENAGMYGCFATENLFNVIHTSDPIAYRINPCLDASYSERIERAVLTLPPVSVSFWARLFKNGKRAEFLRRRAAEARKRVIDKARHAGRDIASTAAMKFKPSYRAGERIERTREEGKRKGKMSEDERGILEPGSENEQDDNHKSNDDDNLTDLYYSDDDDDDDDDGSFARTRTTITNPTSLSSSGNAESEARDFRHENLIRRRMYMLNENGQLDYILQPTGALENQYISILTAHSGYWESKEFAYLVAVESSRSPGVGNTLEDFQVTMKK
ncbi:DDHD domain-containing protein [Lipomyces japonicus]|uniref:DDHD domain-containing protein n=1 Tax=Lipomyces japonicus TaxID=56871 RepID=UPI0034CD13B4